MKVEEEHEMMNLTTTEKTAASEVGKHICLCCLPRELLLLILERLAVLDYLSFRGVCRCWRSAFLQHPTSCLQLRERSPWIIFLRADSTTQPDLSKLSMLRSNDILSEVHPALLTTGRLGCSLTRDVYDIPELHDTRFLLSKYGWLLLFSSSSPHSSSSSLFFFNPFSRLKIDLPFLDVSCLDRPTFGISAPPTSQDCVIFAISLIENHHAMEGGIKVSVCRHGEDEWSTKLYPREEDIRMSFVINVVFAGGKFYCLHRSGRFSAFDVENNSWSRLRGPEKMERTDFTLSGTLVSYSIQLGRDIILCIENEDPVARLNIKLKDPLEAVGGQELRSFMFKITYRILSDAESAIRAMGNSLRFDSFGVDLWFGLCENADEVKKFNWRSIRMWPNAYRRLERSTTIAWLEPRWVQSSESLSWT